MPLLKHATSAKPLTAWEWRSLQIKQLESWAGERLFQRFADRNANDGGRPSFSSGGSRDDPRLDHAKHNTARRRHEWPLRFGFSQFARHELVDEAISGYNEIVPRAKVHASSDCTGRLLQMLEDGRLEAATMTLSIGESDLFMQRVCEDKLLICLRRDDRLAKLEAIPKAKLSERLQVMFHRDYHPVFYDRLLARFRRAGVRIKPTETYSAPSEMQYIVKTRGCLGLIRQHVPLDPDLTVRPIEGLSLKIITAVVSHTDQQRPAIPVLAYRIAQRCSKREHQQRPMKKTAQSVSQVRSAKSPS